MEIENKTSFSCKKRTADKGINVILQYPWPRVLVSFSFFFQLRLIFSSLVLFLTDPKTIIRSKNFNFANSIILQFLSVSYNSISIFYQSCIHFRFSFYLFQSFLDHFMSYKLRSIAFKKTTSSSISIKKIRGFIQYS
jgi:hypothetical protein